MRGKVLNRFVDKRPIAVLVRGTLERALGAEHLNAWFARTAPKPSTRTRGFSTVSALRSQVVLRITPSVRAAYPEQAETVGASLLSVDNKRNGVEPTTSAALVRSRATECYPLMTALEGERAPWFPGYRVQIRDGHGLEASEHRLNVWRDVYAGALPGTSLVVYEPPHGLVRAVLPCEDGHAQERSLLGAVLATVQADDLWIQDRNFCPCAFLGERHARGAGCITRQPEGLPLTVITSWRPAASKPARWPSNGSQAAMPRGARSCSGASG